MGLWNWLTNSSPLISNQEALLARLAAGELALWAVLLGAVLLLRIGFRIGWRLRRKWLAAHLQALEEGRVVPSNVIRDGQVASLEICTASGPRRGTSQVRAVTRRHIALLQPGDVERKCLPIGAPMQVTVAGETAAFRFQSSIVDRRYVAGELMLYVQRPPWVERVQQRAFFRVAVHLPTSVTLLGSSLNECQVLRGVIDNLSGGGFRILLPAEPPPGARLLVRLPIEMLGEAALEARVLRCVSPRRAAPSCVRAQCEFVRLSEEARENILRYCFSVEREWMRRRRKER